MATIPEINRTRVIMDLIKDGEVANLAAYQSVEQIDLGTGAKYARAFWDAYPHPQLFEEDGETPREPTGEELAIFYINRLRQYHGEVLRSVRVKTAAEDARRTEANTVATEITNEIGNDEPIGAARAGEVSPVRGSN